MTTGSSGNGARLADAPIAGGGTPAKDWLRWRPSFPPLHPEDCPSLVVVAAHPDDETLGAGATASAIAGHGIDVHTVVASDGGAAWSDLSARERAQLEEARRRESRCAASMLGLAGPTFLGLPDGELTAHEPQLADVLTEILSDRGAGTWCAATWRGDGHPDHEAVGRAAAVAAHRTGAVLLEYPVWMWHWARPGDADVPWARAMRPAYPPRTALRKHRAIQVFRSQLDPRGVGREAILPPHVVSRLLQVGEVIFR